MAVPETTRKAARAIYEYAGTSGLLPWEELAPTIQISYIEEAEAAISVVCDYIMNLADNVYIDEESLADDVYDENIEYMRAAMIAVAHALDPKVEALDGI
jgi:hypothetical protein